MNTTTTTTGKNGILEDLACWMLQIESDQKHFEYLKTAKTQWHSIFGNAGHYEWDLKCYERMITRKKKVFNLYAKKILL